MPERSSTTAFLTGVVSGAAGIAGAACIYSYANAWWRQQAAEAERAEKSLLEKSTIGSHKQILHPQSVSVADALEDEILSEQFTRNKQFFGQGGQRSIHQAFVIVVGLGGVGSHAAHMLLRAGVGKLRIVDFDQVSLSSLNRHAVATRADVGLPKASVLKEHFARIVPEAEVDARRVMFTAEQAPDLLLGQPDFVIDAIDDINTKVGLLVACHSRGLPVICACGAGAKADPSKVSIADLSEASCDPLARKVRYLLRSQHGIEAGIPMVLSPERPRCSLIPVEQLSHHPHELQIIPNFRIRTVPVLGTTPASFGMAAASFVLCKLAGQPYIPQPIFHVKEEAVELLVERLHLREEISFGNPGAVSLDLHDAGFLVRDIWRAKSARAQCAGSIGEKGLSRFVAHLHFTRWDRRKPAVVDNLVLLTEQEADDHDATTLEQLKASEPEFVRAVEAVLASVRFAFGIDSAR